MAQILDSYARESAAGDKRNLSITGQHGVNLNRIKELGATFGLALDDKGKSAWRPDVTRPDWEKLIARVESGQSNGAVIFDLERFLRRMEDAVRIVNLAKQGFVIYDSDMEYDLNTPAGQKAFYDAASAAQYYSHRLSTRVQRGNRAKATRGEARRGRHRPFGFEEDGTTVRESEREPIREAVAIVLRGGKWRDAIEYLHGLEIMSSAQLHTPKCAEIREGLIGVKYRQYSCECPRRPWIEITIRDTLTAPRMAGYVMLGRTELLGRIPGDPIIDPADWQDLLKLVQSRRGRPSGDYLCSGKRTPVRCGQCGSCLTGWANTRGGKTRLQYRCSPRQGCGRTIASVEALDKAVSAMVIDKLSDPNQVAQMKRAAEALQAKRTPIEKEIDKLRDTKEHWEMRLNAGKITPERHDFLVDDLDRKIARQQAQLAMLKSDDTPEIDESVVQDIRDQWRTASMEVRRQRLSQAYAGLHILVEPGTVLEEDIRYRIKIKQISS